MQRIKLIRNSVTVFDDIRHATSFWQRLRGLLFTRGAPELEQGATNLGPGQGMLISPCSQIHTMGMRYPIDVIFLTREYCVMNVVEQLNPWRTASIRSACHVLEVAAGCAALHRIKSGDQFSLEEVRDA